MRGALRALVVAVAGLTQWLPGAVMASVAALTVALWLWASTEGSLRQALTLAKPLVPSLAPLEWQELNATLRSGGSAAQLRWQQDGLAIELTDAHLGWQFLPLLLGQPLALDVQAAQVRVTDTRPPSPDPIAPPAALQLPLAVTLDLETGPVTWATREGQTPAPLWQKLRAHYAYGEDLPVRGVSAATNPANAPDGSEGQTAHHLRVLELQAAQGSYWGELHVAAQGEWHLQAWLDGQVRTPGPSGVPAQVSAHLNGNLRGTDSALALKARVASPAPGPQADAQATLHPWQPQPLHRLVAEAQRLDLAVFWPELPRTLLSGHAEALPIDSPTGTQWTLDARLTNALPGAWDEGLLPMQRLRLQARGHEQSGQLQQLLAELPSGGHLEAQGTWQGHAWQGQAQAKGVRLTELDGRLPNAVLQASLKLRQRTGTAQQPATTAGELQAQATPVTAERSGKNSTLRNSINEKAAFSSEFSWDGQRLQLAHLRATLDAASLSARGQWLHPAQRWEGEARLTAPGMGLQSQGVIAPQTGEGEIDVQLSDARAFTTWLAGLPALPSRPFQSLPGTEGTGAVHVRWQGGWQDPELALKAQVNMQDLRVHGRTKPSEAWQFPALALQFNGTARQWQASTQGHTQHQGLGARWQARLAGQTPIGAVTPAPTEPPIRRIALDALQVDLGPERGDAVLGLKLTQATAVSAQSNGWTLEPGTLTLQPAHPGTAAAELSWLTSRWGTDGLSTKGHLRHLALHTWADVARRLGFATLRQSLDAAGVDGTLAVQGDWSVEWPQPLQRPPQARLTLQRESGDLSVEEPAATAASPRPRALLGLSQALVELSTQENRLHTRVSWDSERAGRLQARATIPLPSPPHADWAGWLPTAETPLEADVSANLPDIGVWSRLAPPGWRIKGRLDLNAQARGTLGQPGWQGRVNGSALEVRSVVEGLAFGNGSLSATLSGERLDLAHLRLEGDGGEAQAGSLTLSGQAAWPAALAESTTPAAPRVTLQATAQRLRVSARADRRLTVSGQVQAQLSPGVLQLRGQLTADQALFVLPDETAPSLGTDVVVRLEQATPAVPAAPPLRTDVQVAIDLGPQFNIRGHGLQTRLKGQLTVGSSTRQSGLQVVGEVRTADGTYRAYGQQLRIDSGVLRFSGPYDDPSLDVLALRGKATPGARMGDGADAQQVGVQISGSARAPRVTLYASPDLPDSEKLAWLVLGRPASGVGAETAVLQQAALALLSNNSGLGSDKTLASVFGLDEIGVRNTSNDSTNTPSAALTLGKRLSERFYVSYEQSLGAAMGVVSLFYDVSQRLTLRAQAGQTSALDLIFTHQKD